MNNHTNEIQHSFDVSIANEIGIEPAIIFKNITFWVFNNFKKKKNKKDGRYWTYNSLNDFLEIFDYMSRSKIYRSLKKLEDEGYIISGSFNKMKNDKTKWYSLSDKYLPKQMFHNETGVFHNETGVFHNETTLPDINTDINTNERDARDEIQKQLPLKDQVKKEKNCAKKEKEPLGAFQWLKQNYPSMYEQGFAMKFKKDLDRLDPKERISLVENFNDTVIVEGLDWDSSKILARLRRYSRNWLSNKDRFGSKDNKTVRPKLDRF